MNITKLQMQAIRRLVSKADKELIANKAGCSVRTVEAVLQGDRHTDIVKKVIYQVTFDIWENLGKHLNAIQIENKEFATIQDYNEAKKSAMWAQTREYDRYIDIYLCFTGHEWKELDELWGKIVANYPDIIQYQFYCIDLMTRLTGIAPKHVINFYNKNV